MDASFALLLKYGQLLQKYKNFGACDRLVSLWNQSVAKVRGKFNAAQIRRDAGKDVADTPLLVTLNCAPVDDGGSGVCASAWTPDYASAVVETLTAHGMWPPGLVPLVVEFRAVCPVLLAASLSGVAHVRGRAGMSPRRASRGGKFLDERQYA